jgi:hypothetical protein
MSVFVRFCPVLRVLLPFGAISLAPYERTGIFFSRKLASYKRYPLPEEHEKRKITLGPNLLPS